MISDVSRVTSGVAETVQAQTLATGEIASNIEHAFAGFRDISANIHGVTENAGETERLAKGTKEASTTLATESQRLAEEVRAFIQALRRGPLDRRQDDEAVPSGEERRAARRPPVLKLAA
jgi:methyl-accepting chemotaxis protein